MAEHERKQCPPVLACYYEHSVPLVDYLAACLPDFEALRDGPETSSFQRLLEDAYVAWRGQTGAPRACVRDDTSDIDIAWIIRRVQLELFRANSRTANVLCFGYKMTEGNLVNKLSNSSLTEMQESADWRRLFTLTGSGAFKHILKHASLFLALPNASFRQVCGDPIYDLARLSDLSKKRKAEPNDGPAHRPSKRPAYASPSEITLNRSAIYYAGSTKSEARQTGLPSHHVLNRLQELYPRSGESGHKDNSAAARYLSKHIWSKEYNISVEGRTPKQRAIALDNAISSQGMIGTPKRLRGVLPLLEEIISNHRKLDYASLRQRCCPSALKKRKLNDEEKEILLGVIAEDAHIPLTQGGSSDSLHSTDAEQSLEISRISILARSSAKTSEKAESQKEKPRFAEFTIPHYQVIRFASAVLHSLLPKDILGSEANSKHLTILVEQFVMARRFEKSSIHHITQGFSQLDCGWLQAGKKATFRATSASHQRDKDLVASLLVWVLDDLLVDLIRTNFYVTESAALQRKTLYFLQSDWQVICQPLLEKMTSTLFDRLKPEDAAVALGAPGRRLDFSHVRLLPKEKGVRPVVNLSRKPPPKNSQTYTLSINQLLQNTFSILSYEKERADLTGSAVQSANDVFSRLKAFKAKLSSGSHKEKLYFVKLDIRSCFDTISQDRLLAILERILSQDVYTVSRHVSMFVNRDRVFRRFRKEARSVSDMVNFPDLACDLAESLGATVFVDQVRASTEKREAVLKLLREHVKENIVKIGSQYYQQKVGIPQGSVLSTLLCNFFYGEMERSELSFLQDASCCLLRLVDDFLLITTRRDLAERFLRKMLAGHPEYGCFVSSEKTRVNFDIASVAGSQAIKKADEGRGFPWCGYLIDPQSLEVMYDYTRLQGTHLGNGLTVRTHKQPGEAFVISLVQLFQLKVHPIYYDLSFASATTVYTNAYQAVQLMAMRYHSYIRIWRPSIARSTMFFLNAIHRMIFEAWKSIKNCFKQKRGPSAKVADASCPRKNLIVWLGYRAFLLVLSQKPTAYRVIIRHLRQICKSKGSKSMHAQLQGALKHPSNGDLRKIQY